LNQAGAAHTRLWYLAYPGVASPITASTLRRQLEPHATRLETEDLGYVTATLYILPEEPAFATDEGSFQPVRFGGQLRVVGAALHENAPAPAAGGKLRFRLRWEAESEPQADYGEFIHLIDAAGHLRKVGRGQELLVDGRTWPTSFWKTGEGVEPEYTLGLPPGLPPGTYRVFVGLAEPEGGDWLPVLDSQGQIVDTTAPVLAVEVGAAATVPDPEALHLARPADVSWMDAAGAPLVSLMGSSSPGRAEAGQRIVLEAGWLGEMAGTQDLQVQLGLLARRNDRSEARCCTSSTPRRRRIDP
jgi:hypothetical protein